ncbi:AMP-dependent synthetase/ligase [Jatrophihabitans sp. YIM 134969]
MREFSVPATGTEPTVVNAASWVSHNAATHPRRVAVRRRSGEAWVDVDSATVGADVDRLAKGLIAWGLQPGDRVGLMGATSYEWMIADFAILAVGAVTVPIYETSSADQVDWIVEDSGAVAVFAQTTLHQDVVESVRRNAPSLREVWCIDNGAFKVLGAAGEKTADADLTARRDAVRSDDLASIIYTSGTTGRPKGCELTHGNFVSEVDTAATMLGDFLNDDSSVLLFLPTAHVLGRIIQLGAIATGCTIGHTSDIKNLVPLLESFRPTFVLSVPRVFEKVYNTAKQRAHADGRGKIFDLADRHAVAWSKALDTPSGPGLKLKAEHAVISRLVFSKILAALGGNCIAAVSGGAPLGERLGHFFRGVGVTVYEGFGLTETSAAITVNRPGAIKIGTVGQPLPGATVKVADDGELLFSGPMVFRGYWQNDEATKETITDGWFHTGDIGEIDSDGFVKITGRKKEIIVTAGGKNVAPAVLEDRARAHWLVGQMLVVGDQQPFIAALVTIDPESWPTWLSKNGKPADARVADFVDDPALRAEVQTAIDDANTQVSHAEQIKKFVIVPEDWSEENGQLTPSLKLKRNVVVKQNADEIAALYAK